MREIRGDAKNIRSLLGGSRFAIDYYQREYRWEKKQVTELIDDLCAKFLESHEPGNERSAVENYGHYFLGSIIISDKNGKKFIIDGQQRLTSLTLLLIYIYRQIEDDEQRGQLADLIFSQKFGKRSFNLAVPERTECMEALLGLSRLLLSFGIHSTASRKTPFMTASSQAMLAKTVPNAQSRENSEAFCMFS